MYVDLTNNEMRTLIQVLDERLNAIRHEIIHTSTHDYKTILRDRERVLRCLHDKLVTYDALYVA